MHIKDIELFNISKYRAEHMGAAMLMVILFHVALPRSDMFFGLRRMGNIGVDIFLFLSGIGLWYSWMKNTAPHPQRGELCKNASLANEAADRTILKNSPFGGWGAAWLHFYWRRLVRIYPAWLVIACLYYIPRFDGTHWFDILGDILINWDFWLHDELTFWYIPATMMLYIFAPPYMELIRRHPIYRWLVVVMIMWCILVQYVIPIHHAVGHIEIFWSRVPIFFLGINMAESVRQKQSLDGQGIWILWIMFGMSLATSIWLEQEIHGHFPLFLERMLYIPLTISTVLILNRIFRRTPRWVNKCFAFVGTLSLEAYLIHIEFVLKPIEHNYHLGYWPTFLLTVAITLPLAWFLQTIITKTLKAIGV